MRTKNKKITPMQLKFAELIAQGISADKAYVDCGYKGLKNPSKNAHNLLNNEFVKAHITELQLKSTTDTILTLSGAKQILSDIANGNESKHIVIKALDSLARLSSWEKQKIDLSISRSIEDMSDEDLASLV